MQSHCITVQSEVWSEGLLFIVAEVGSQVSLHSEHSAHLPSSHHLLTPTRPDTPQAAPPLLLLGSKSLFSKWNAMSSLSPGGARFRNRLGTAGSCRCKDFSLCHFFVFLILISFPLGFLRPSSSLSCVSFLSVCFTSLSPCETSLLPLLMWFTNPNPPSHLFPEKAQNRSLTLTLSLSSRRSVTVILTV